MKSMRISPSMSVRVLCAVAASTSIVLVLVGASSTCAVEAVPLCAADCNDDRRVSIDELVSCTRASVSGSDVVPACCDADGDGRLAVADLVSAVSGALHGCAVTCA